MNKDTVIGIGVGLLVGWLLWRRRQGLALAGGCGGCGSATATGSGSGSGGCGQATSAGIGNFQQGAGPSTIPNF